MAEKEKRIRLYRIRSILYLEKYFRLLYRNLTACNKIYGDGILQDITGEIDFVKLEEGHYRGSNIFSWRGEKYIACIEYDLTKDIPEFYYSVSDIELSETEGYNALY